MPNAFSDGEVHRAFRRMFRQMLRPHGFLVDFVRDRSKSGVIDLQWAHPNRTTVRVTASAEDEWITCLVYLPDGPTHRARCRVSDPATAIKLQDWLLKLLLPTLATARILR